MSDGDTFEMLLSLRGGTPVIYLFPPQPLPTSTVSLRLIPHWHIYPLTDTTMANRASHSPSLQASTGYLSMRAVHCCRIGGRFILDIPPLDPADKGAIARQFHPEQSNAVFPNIEAQARDTYVCAPTIPEVPSVSRQRTPELSLHTSALKDFVARIGPRAITGAIRRTIGV
ncbi:hypothetical protein C8Q74DRAFT_1366296 [Fomes fomentarius]|nr:hypothetical protein C8Q74DRAFT_1366296 [Fomes fomentarius]